MTFDYSEAFSRNIGWVTPQEQEKLRAATIAIAGNGGVGGFHALTLARLGIGALRLSDLDDFEVANFNRQIGATMATVGRPKVEVIAEMAKQINPELEIEIFPQGVHRENGEEFLNGVDVYVDGLDYFAVQARRSIFDFCHRLSIPAVTAAPLGMGAAVLSFLPGKMSFEQYFRLDGVSEQEQLVRFLLGLSPRMLQRNYLVWPEAVDFDAHKGPSTGMACAVCAGMASTEVLKIVLNRGKVVAAPWGVQFDAYRCKFVKTWRPGGNRNPLQRIALAIATRQLANMKK